VPQNLSGCAAEEDPAQPSRMALMGKETLKPERLKAEIGQRADPSYRR
jgi:hypothetical protein